MNDSNNIQLTKGDIPHLLKAKKIKFSDVPASMKTTELCQYVLNHSLVTIDKIPDHLKNIEMCLVAVERNGQKLVYIPAPLKTAAVCRAAVTQNARALQYVPESNKDYKMCLRAVLMNPFTWRFTSPSFKRTVGADYVHMLNYGLAKCSHRDLSKAYRFTLMQRVTIVVDRIAPFLIVFLAPALLGAIIFRGGWFTVFGYYFSFDLLFLPQIACLLVVIIFALALYVPFAQRYIKKKRKLAAEIDLNESA